MLVLRLSPTWTAALSMSRLQWSPPLAQRVSADSSLRPTSYFDEHSCEATSEQFHARIPWITSWRCYVHRRLARSCRSRPSCPPGAATYSLWDRQGTASLGSPIKCSNALSDAGWLTAEHYCYLGDADGERNERVLSETVFGSLVGRMAAADPTLVVQHRPRFAADEEALESCVRRSLAKDPNRKVALVIDGVDHITRVRARAGDRFDPSKSLAESLAALNVPAGSVVILLSQPGSHLQPLEQVGARTVAVPGLSRDEIELLAVRLNVLPGARRNVACRAAVVGRQRGNRTLSRCPRGENHRQCSLCDVSLSRDA